MFKRPSGQAKLQKLPARPTETELKGFVKTAAQERQTKFNYFWTSAEDSRKEYMVSVKSAAGAEDTFEWRMFLGSGPTAKELWFHVTKDLTQIYAMIIKASGEHLEEAVVSDRMAATGRQHIVELLSTTFDGSKTIAIDELQKLRPQESALSGELSLVHITNILQSISMAAMSGRLRVDSHNKRADLFFIDGTPVHATGTMGEGPECMLRAIGLEEGQFHFEPKLRTDEVTITDGLESIILQGVHLVDNTRFLTKQGITNDSVLARKNPDLTELEFEELVRKGEPINLSMMKAFYLLIDGRCTLKELLNRTGLPRSKWVPLVANLFRCDTVCVSQVPSVRLRVDPKYVEPHLLDSFMTSVIHKETGIFTFPMTIFMLRHEAMRAGPNHSLSLILFQLQPAKPTVGSSSLPSSLLKELMRRITELKRPIDFLGHYEKGEFALILPEMRALDAVSVAEKIESEFRSTAMVQNVDVRSLYMAFGVASIPDDVADANTLLSAAELALNQCRSAGVSVMMARNAGP